MLRFTTTAIAANAARCSFASSAVLLGTHTGELISLHPEHPAEILPPQTQQRQLLDELTALKETNATLEKRCVLLSAEVERLAVLKAYRRNFSIVAQGLHKVDYDYRRRFNTHRSLLHIWRTWKQRRDREAISALEAFLDANKQWLPEPLHVEFFEAWRNIRDRTTYYSPLRREVQPKLTRDNVKPAVDVSCSEVADDVRAAIVAVILRSVEECDDGASPPTNPPSSV